MTQRDDQKQALSGEERIVRVVTAATPVAVTWWCATSRIHNNHFDSGTFGFLEYVLVGLVLGAVSCFALKIVLPLAHCRRLHPVTWAFVFTMGGWLAVSQIQTKAEFVFSGGPRPFAAYHFPRGWPLATTDTVIIHEQRPGGLFARSEMNIHSGYLAGDIVVWIVMVGCGGYVCEQTLRARFRFSLRTAFTVFATAGVLLTVHRYSPSLIYPVESESHGAMHRGESEWYMRLPAAICVATVIGTAIHVSWACGVSIVRRSQHPGPCQD